LTRVGEDFWHIKTTIEFRNAGAGRAYVRLGTRNLIVVEDELHGNSLDIVNGFIDPTGDPVIESAYFFQPGDAPLSEYAQQICDGISMPRISGFIEYETVGVRFHRNFSYVWIGHGNPLNIGARLMLSDDSIPKTDEDRISFGYWLSNSDWMSGWSGDNEEYEMKPEEKGRKPRHSPNQGR
jgi:hypothetical protein